MTDALKRGPRSRRPDIDAALRGHFRVTIRLGLLDPPERVPVREDRRPGEPEPWSQPADARARPRGHAQVDRAPEELGGPAAARSQEG